MEKNQQAFRISSLQTHVCKHRDKQNSDYFVIIRTFNTLKLSIGARQYEVPGNKQIFIHPKRKFHLISPENSSGYILSFTASFYEKSGLDSYLLYSKLFFDEEGDIHVTETSLTEADFKQVVIDRLDRCPDNEMCLYAALAHNCIEYLLLEGLVRLQIRPIIVSEGIFSPDRTVNTYLVLVNTHCKKQIRVADYADMLHITPRKLSELCRDVLGRSAKQILSEAVLTLALRYIRTTDLSISQIAYEMGFTDDGNFRRFIKKHTGLVPSAFRKR